LEELYMVASSGVEGGGFAHSGAEDTEDVREDVRALQKNTVELCRKMRAVDRIVPELRNFQETRPAAVIQFLKTLADMQDLTLKRLTTTVEEERSRQELLDYYRIREEEATKKRQQLDRDLNQIRKECERAQSQRNDILLKLKADLFEVKDRKTERMNQLQARYEQRMRDAQETFNAKRDELTKRINQLKESNKKLRQNSQEEEIGKKKTAKRYEKEVDDVIQQYDREVKDLASHKSEHDDLFKKDSRRLNDLKERFEKVEQEKLCIEAEEAIAEARRKKMEDEQERRNYSSSLVQAFWRGIMQRQEFVQMKKAKKKKGGAKKGKKGK
jgi:chromosome segregation ATPase